MAGAVDDSTINIVMVIIIIIIIIIIIMQPGLVRTHFAAEQEKRQWQVHECRRHQQDSLDMHQLRDRAFSIAVLQW